MNTWKMSLLILSLTANVMADSSQYELRDRGTEGKGLFIDGKFIKYYPMVSRSDLDKAINDLDKYSLSSSQRSSLRTNLISDYENKLRPATDKELIEVSFALSKMAEKSLEEIKVNCNEESGIKSKSNDVAEKEEHIYCECEFPKDVQLSLKDSISAPSFEDEYWDDFSLVGRVDSSSFKVDTTNDNYLHGLFAKLGGKPYDGNDRGRTFGLNFDYTLKGSEGEFRVNYESVIFTQLHEADKEGFFYVNDKGEFLQDLLERNRLDVSLRRNGEDDMYYIGGIELEEIRDDGMMSGPIQQAWHKVGKSIKYDNQDFRDDEINLTVYGGIGKTWMNDLGNWKCTSKIEGTVGQNILDFGDTYAKVRGEVELNSNELFGRNEKNPFIVLSAWTQGSLETEGDYEVGAGVNMSLPRTFGKWEIKPEIGMSIKNEKEDRYFTQSQSSKIEPESHIAITFTRKF